MPGPRKADVVVVGLGPAGASAAAEAAATGASVFAFDRRREAGLPVQCAELVPALIGQDARDIAPTVQQAIRAMTTQVEQEPPDSMSPFPGCMIDRAAFDRLLVERARGAGAVCRFGLAARAIDADGTILTTGGERIAARVVIGADGPWSRCGRAIGSVNRALVYARQVRVELRAPQDATDIFLSNAAQGGYGWLFPRGATANLGVGVDADARSRLKPLLAALHDALHAAGRVGRSAILETGGAIPAGGMLRPGGFVGACLFLLAGDAAGLSNPVTGAGIQAAVASGRLAGAAALAALAGDAAALENYAEDLDERFGPALRRALIRRRHLRASHDARGAVTPAELRAAWIAYPDYWAPAGAPPTPSEASA